MKTRSSGPEQAAALERRRAAWRRRPPGLMRAGGFEHQPHDDVAARRAGCAKAPASQQEPVGADVLTEGPAAATPASQVGQRPVGVGSRSPEVRDPQRPASNHEAPPAGSHAGPESPKPQVTVGAPGEHDERRSRRAATTSRPDVQPGEQADGQRGERAGALGQPSARAGPSAPGRSRRSPSSSTPEPAHRSPRPPQQVVSREHARPGPPPAPAASTAEGLMPRLRRRCPAGAVPAIRPSQHRQCPSADRPETSWSRVISAAFTAAGSGGSRPGTRREARQPTRERRRSAHGAPASAARRASVLAARSIAGAGRPPAGTVLDPRGLLTAPARGRTRCPWPDVGVRQQCHPQPQRWRRRRRRGCAKVPWNSSPRP